MALLASIAALAEGRPNADDDKAQRPIAALRAQAQSHAKTDRELAAAVPQPDRARQSAVDVRAPHVGREIQGAQEARASKHIAHRAR